MVVGGDGEGRREGGRESGFKMELLKEKRKRKETSGKEQKGQTWPGSQEEGTGREGEVQPLNYSFLWKYHLESRGMRGQGNTKKRWKEAWQARR